MNEPAFPTDDLREHFSGMSLRDYFAAKAMQARAQEFLNHDHDHLADWAYTIADAMLEARKSQKEKV